MAELEALLSPDERARAASFRSPLDADRFVIRRGLLRTLLSFYLPAKPADIRFVDGCCGKPLLDPGRHAPCLSFNLARAGDMVLYAVTGGRAVGVDVEFVEPLPDLEGLTTSVLTRREAAVIRTLPEDQRLVAFFKDWTRKEAYLKALGDGLARPPDQVDVGQAFRIETIVPAQGYLGAVAAEGNGWQLRSLDWPPESSAPC